MLLFLTEKFIECACTKQRKAVKNIYLFFLSLFSLSKNRSSQKKNVSTSRVRLLNGRTFWGANSLLRNIIKLCGSRAIQWLMSWLADTPVHLNNGSFFCPLFLGNGKILPDNKIFSWKGRKMILKYDWCLIYASHNKGSVRFELNYYEYVWKLITWNLGRDWQENWLWITVSAPMPLG